MHGFGPWYLNLYKEEYNLLKYIVVLKTIIRFTITTITMSPVFPLSMLFQHPRERVADLSYHCVEMIQWLCDNPLTVWKLPKDCVVIQLLC